LSGFLGEFQSSLSYKVWTQQPESVDRMPSEVLEEPDWPAVLRALLHGANVSTAAEYLLQAL